MSGMSSPPAKKGKGGRKKSLRPPSPAILKQRREAANARERKRMNGLNDAFERLREVVPNLTTEQKMSKIETLHMAQTYIKALASLIEREERKEMLGGGGGLDLEDPCRQVHSSLSHHGGGVELGGVGDYQHVKLEPGGGGLSEMGLLRQTEGGSSSCQL